MRRFDVVIAGAGAAGMMCAAIAGQRGRSVLVIDHADTPGKKIRISGGGRCNFTNIHSAPSAFLSENPRFAISALKRYTPRHFIDLVDRYKISWHEKALGQLFCDGSAQQIIDLLISEMKMARVELALETTIEHVARGPNGYALSLSSGPVECASLVIATGGKSIPKMGATGFAYELARQFEIPVIDPRPALVPLTFEPGMLEKLKPLAGIAVDARVSHKKTAFDEAMLFTHRGLSGPAILQISSYWRPGDAITIDMARDVDVGAKLDQARKANGRQSILNGLATFMPRKVAELVVAKTAISGNLADLSKKQSNSLQSAIKAWAVKPVGSEGYRTAEVTLGGIDTGALSSTDMQVKSSPGLYFIGEAVDVTGWLGGYNFQWAWASGWCAGQTV